MVLNGSPLGINPLNGVLRVPVIGESEWLVNEFATDLVATKYQHGTGEADCVLLPELDQTLIRFGGGDLSLKLVRELLETVSRSGEGSALLETAADLYYTREVFGFGGADLALELRGDVGVVFLDGESTVSLPAMIWEGARLRTGEGAAEFSLEGSLTASAVRRAETRLELVSVHCVLEPSHRDSADVLWLGGFGERLFGLQLQDAGMLRQAFLGSIDLNLQAQGIGRIERPKLSGASVINIGSSGDFRVLRHGSGTATTSLDFPSTWEVFVPGDGMAQIQVSLLGTAYKMTSASMSMEAAGVEMIWSGARLRPSDGYAILELDGAIDGVRRRHMTGAGVMSLLASSSAYRNLYAEDDQEQLFARPGIHRDFLSPSRTREWNRK